MTLGDYLRPLQGIFTLWLSVLIVMALALLMQLVHQSATEQALDQAQQAWHLRQQQALDLANHQSEIDFYFASRARWQALGLLEAPHFDQWDATLAAIQQQSSLPDVAYKMQPSKHCSATTCLESWPAEVPPALNFTVTPIQLDWLLTHESAVSDWFEQLKVRFGERLFVRHCRWSLASGKQAIAAQCDVDLFNFPGEHP